MNPDGSSPFKGGPSRKRRQAYSVAAITLEAAANVAESSDILAPLKAACRTTKLILDNMQAVDNNQEGWADLTQRMEGYMLAIENQIESFAKYPPEDREVNEAFSRPLTDYVDFLEESHRNITNQRHKRKRSGLNELTEVSKVMLDADTIRKFNRDIEDQHRKFIDALSLFTAYRIQAVERDNKAILANVDNSAILQLPMVAFVASSVHTTCLQGTRQAVLKTISHWAGDDTSHTPIFWLCDIAGSGKSTVAMSTAAIWKAEGTLGGQFFFSMADSEASTTEKFCPTMARELADHMPELAPHITEAVTQHPAIMRTSLCQQFRTFITGPIRNRKKRVIFVIDAVDECKAGRKRKELLEALATATRESTNLKIFITSRPDPAIETVLQPLSIKRKLEKMEDRLHDVDHFDNTDDIAVYVDQLLHGVLSEDNRQRLVKKADGLFIWASTACRMLTSETRWSSPEDIYNRLISVEQPGVIDDVYDLLLERTDPEGRLTTREILALLLAAFEPLTVGDLDDLLKHTKIGGSAEALIRNLGSVVTRDETNLIHFRHPTFVEYLKRRSTSPVVDSHSNFHINVGNAHGQIASWCFQRLKSRKDGLKFNICQIESSFYLNSQIPDLDARISKFIPTALRYVSYHWLFHVAETDDNWRRILENDIRHVIQIPYVLNWIEILSITGGIPRLIRGLRSVSRHTGVSGLSG
ncbi:related to S. pombe trp-asp repeat containing protein [Serendipita indica DSM 11827]|uniref:Related to S. pombe trp-asp repeat containing protein n=1 Tax=Serendipita indica (strain DSM 11827) TaxID=1109443 RepID=G4TTZ9_SERID|nr:related to S. pombe trp-asp repeat containing protein [Serendipita indica DSM 11827]